MSKSGLTQQSSGALSKSLHLLPAPGILTPLVSGVVWASGASEAPHIIPVKVEEPLASLGHESGHAWREAGELKNISCCMDRSHRVERRREKEAAEGALTSGLAAAAATTV